MKFAMMISGVVVAMTLASGNVMAEEEGDKVRTRTEATEQLNMQGNGEQTMEQVRNRYEDGEGSAEGEQYKHQHQHQHQGAQGATGSRASGGAARR